MQNAWNVQWRDGEKLVQKVFEGESPKASGAVPFANELRGRGILADIISRRHGYPPSLKHRNPPQLGMLWCPYCIKWKDFQETAVRHSDYVTPVLLRCPTCTISIMDYYVRLYNPIFAERYFTAKDMRKHATTETQQTNGRRRIRVRR